MPEVTSNYGTVLVLSKYFENSSNYSEQGSCVLTKQNKTKVVKPGSMITIVLQIYRRSGLIKVF